MTTFGPRIKALRKQYGYSLQDVGDHAGRTKSAIWEIESRDTDPRLSTIKALAHCFGMTVGELLDEKEPPGRLEIYQAIAPYLRETI